MGRPSPPAHPPATGSKPMPLKPFWGLGGPGLVWQGTKALPLCPVLRPGPTLGNTPRGPKWRRDLHTCTHRVSRIHKAFHLNPFVPLGHPVCARCVTSCSATSPAFIRQLSPPNIAYPSNPYDPVAHLLQLCASGSSHHLRNICVPPNTDQSGISIIWPRRGVQPRTWPSPSYQV